MRTFFGPIAVETKGYDVAAELESQGDRYGMASYIRKREQECREQARRYLAEHPKTTYYVMTGHPSYIDDDADLECIHLVAYTDDEVQRIKQLFVELYNTYLEDPSMAVNSFEELADDYCTSSETEGGNDELDALVWKRAEEDDFYAKSIDLLHPVHSYRFREWEYLPHKDEMGRKLVHSVILTDEEYLYLLTQQLMDRHFSFNRLLLVNPRLAQKICDATDGDEMFPSFSPYLILMDEVVKDMEQILGHEPVDDELCSYNEDGHSYHAHMIVEKDKMEVYWEDLPDGDFAMEHLTQGRVKGIDAKAVRKLFGAADYEEMLERIKERFQTHTAYDDFLAYLHENNIFEHQEVANLHPSK